MRIRAAVSLVILLSLLTSCTRPRLVPVEGTVTLDGIPLAYVTLSFISETGVAAVNAFCETDHAGKYSLITVNPKAAAHQNGVVAGRYRVTVIRIPRLPPQRSYEIPPAYSSEDLTPLVIDVPPGGGIYDIVLTTNPGGA